MDRNCRLRHKVEMLAPPLPWDKPRWRNRDGPVVVLLHGLWRGWRAMEPLARMIGNEGFATLNLPYPSARLPVPTLVDFVRREVMNIADDRPVHFVTHSLGGIIARSLIAQAPPWNCGRLVMLAPPNGGSEIVDWSKRHPLVHHLLGPAGRSLGSDGIPVNLPGLPHHLEAMAIMGKHASIPFFKRMLETNNDGIVSASRGQIPGLKGFTVIDADHTFIQMHPEAIRMTVGFLRSGQVAD